MIEENNRSSRARGLSVPQAVRSRPMRTSCVKRKIAPTSRSSCGTTAARSIRFNEDAYASVYTEDGEFMRGRRHPHRRKDARRSRRW